MTVGAVVIGTVGRSGMKYLVMLRRYTGIVHPVHGVVTLGGMAVLAISGCSQFPAIFNDRFGGRSDPGGMA